MLRELDACTTAAARCGVPSSELPDIAQTASLAAWRTLERGVEFLTVEGVRAWMREVGRRLAREYCRARHRIPEPRDPYEIAHKTPATVPSAEALALAQSPRAQLDVALDELAERRPELFTIIEAHDLQGRSMREIAAEQHIELGTAWNRHRLGVEALRASLHRAAAREQGGRR